MLADKIRAACPSEEECLKDEDACFKIHPVHPAEWHDGTIIMVYADVNGLVNLILEALWPTP